MTKTSKTYCAWTVALAISVFLPWVQIAAGGLLFALGGSNNGSLSYWDAEWPWGAVVLALCAVGICAELSSKKPWSARIPLLCAMVANGIVGLTFLRLLWRMNLGIHSSSADRDLRSFLALDLHLSWGWPFLVASSVLATSAAVSGLREAGITILPRLDREFFRAWAKWILGFLAVLLVALSFVGYSISQRPKHYRYYVSPEQASEEHYDLFREGMTYAEANACLDRPNHFPPRMEDLQPGKECWVHWANDFPDIPSVGLSITVRLRGGRVVEKSEQHRAQDAQSELEGTWDLISSERDGEELKILTGAQMVTAGNKVVFKVGDQVTLTGKLKVDSNKRPRTADVTSSEGPDKGKTLKGIYERVFDYKLGAFIVKYCRTDTPEQERPKEFKTKAGTGGLSSVYKLAKP